MLLTRKIITLEDEEGGGLAELVETTKNLLLDNAEDLMLDDEGEVTKDGIDKLKHFI